MSIWEIFSLNVKELLKVKFSDPNGSNANIV